MTPAGRGSQCLSGRERAGQVSPDRLQGSASSPVMRVDGGGEGRCLGGQPRARPQGPWGRRKRRKVEVSGREELTQGTPVTGQRLPAVSRQSAEPAVSAASLRRGFLKAGNTHACSDGSLVTEWALTRGINPADESDPVMACVQAPRTGAPTHVQALRTTALRAGVCRGRGQSPLGPQTPPGPSGQPSGCHVQPFCRLWGPVTSGTNLLLWRLPLCFPSNSLNKY